MQKVEGSRSLQPLLTEAPQIAGFFVARTLPTDRSASLYNNSVQQTASRASADRGRDAGRSTARGGCGAGDRDRGKGVATPEQPREPKQSWRAQTGTLDVSDRGRASSSLDREPRASTLSSDGRATTGCAKRSAPSPTQAAATTRGPQTSMTALGRAAPATPTPHASSAARGARSSGASGTTTTPTTPSATPRCRD